MAYEILDDSLRLAAINTSISEGTKVSEKPRLQGTGTPQIEIYNKLLLCYNFNDALTYLPFFIFRYCESVVLYIIYWKWLASCHVFVKWPVGIKQLAHARLSYSLRHIGHTQSHTCNGYFKVVVALL